MEGVCSRLRNDVDDSPRRAPVLRVVIACDKPELRNNIGIGCGVSAIPPEVIIEPAIQQKCAVPRTASIDIDVVPLVVLHGWQARR